MGWKLFKNSGQANYQQNCALKGLIKVTFAINGDTWQYIYVLKQHIIQIWFQDAIASLDLGMRVREGGSKNHQPHNR